MNDSEWVWGSKKSEGRKGKPLKVSANKKCPKCDNPIDTYSDGTVGRHKDYGKDSKGKPKTRGPWAYCSYNKWR